MLLSMTRPWKMASENQILLRAKFLKAPKKMQKIERREGLSHGQRKRVEMREYFVLLSRQSKENYRNHGENSE
jgi:hypothetical protein